DGRCSEDHGRLLGRDRNRLLCRAVVCSQEAGDARDLSSAARTSDPIQTIAPAGARCGCGILAPMFTFRIRGSRWWLGAIAAARVVSLAALLLRPMLERAVRARIESAAARHGVVARVGLIHVGFQPLLRLEGVDLDLGHGARLHADMISATWPR